MPNKLSHSAVQMFTTCGRKYDLHYNQKLRSKYTSSPLLFGTAIDTGLNKLLETRDHDLAVAAFEKAWKYQPINKVYTDLRTAKNVLYSKKDFDKDLLHPEDYTEYETYKTSQGIQSETSMEVTLDYLTSQKNRVGLGGLEEFEQSLYSYANWLSMRRKGLLMIKAYHEKVLPKIKEVVVIQQGISLENNVGDKVTGFLDLIVVWEDGKRYLLDNKTSSIPYAADSAGIAPQLVLYYHASKDKYQLDGVGFIVMNKHMTKMKIKTCSVCGFISKGSHKTCNNEPDGNRCNAAWDITVVPPFCDVSFIVPNDVTEVVLDQVVTIFDEANEQIKQGCFEPNFKNCFQFGAKCSYFSMCHDNDSSDLIDMKDNK